MSRQAADLRFAELLDEAGNRLHVGCVMTAGYDWVEISLPHWLEPRSGRGVRFHPRPEVHRVAAGWRCSDRAGFTYLEGGPPEEQFSALGGLYDPRPASARMEAAS